MLTGVHFLLTYTCNLKCDSCFLYCGPEAEGTFTIGALRKVFDEIARIGTVEWVYFEGGEPFLFYPLLAEALRISHDMGLKSGIVTNSYWATSEEDAGLWLKPLCDLKVADLSVSDDLFHHGEEKANPAKTAFVAAKKLGLPVNAICIEEPAVSKDEERDKGAPVIGGNVKFRGRAVEKLTSGLPERPWRELNKCPYEELEAPKRVHVDPCGNVHVCQGLSMGNMWETPLSALIENYDAGSHPVCGPLARGGPALLSEEYNVGREDGYVDECHFCYLVRMALIDRFPQYLAPRQVYGLE
jgi:hypothetical protein